MGIKFQLLRLLKNIRLFAYGNDDIPASRIDGQLYYIPDRPDPDGPLFLQHLGNLRPIGGTGTTGKGSGFVYIYDITGSGGVVVSDKTYQDAGNNVLQSCTISGSTINVFIRSSYPLINVYGVSAQLPKVGDIFSGSVALSTVVTGDIAVETTTPDGLIGATDSVAVTLNAGPEVLDVHFTGGYPGSQTELKAGDTYDITGTTDKTASSIEVIDYGAGTSEILSISPPGTSFTVTMTISNRGTTTQQLPARIRARDAVGAYGSTRDTNTGGGTTDGYHIVSLNNTYPALSIGTITYPVGQGALKGSETATVANTASSYDTIAYDSPNGDISITSPTTFQNPKTVQRIAGSYNISTNNFRIVANRAANDATTTVQGVVQIANVAATVQVTEPAARLRSGGNDGTSPQDHTISIVSDQQLYEAPTLDAGVGGGTWQGGGFVGGPSTWTRALRVHDNDVKGTYTWSNLSAKNLAGIITSAITGDTSYVLGGFVARTLTFAAFSQTTTLNVEVITYSKLSAGIFTATNQPALRNATQGNHDDIINTYTVDTLGTNPTTLWWNDISAAASNSGGTAQITNVQETA